LVARSNRARGAGGKMQTLGITFSHDSGVCLYRDGEIVSFYKEERLSRKKRDKFPILSLTKCLNKVKGNIDAIAFGPILPEDEWMINRFISIIQKHEIDLSNTKIFNLVSEHHLQHAALAFYNSGFNNANVIVIDRNGSVFFDGGRESETIFYAEYPNNIKPIYKSFWIFNNYAQEKIERWGKKSGVSVDACSMYGIVKVYEAATTMIGQDALENGKTMGLSAYGNHSVFPNNFFVNSTNIPNDFYFSHKTLIDDGDYQTIYRQLAEKLTPEKFSKNNYLPYANLASAVQKQTEDAVCFLVEKAYSMNKNKNIVLTGGYALNVVCNKKLIEKYPELNFYFEPLADDSGNCIGAAMFAYRMISNDSTIFPISNTFFHGEIEKNYNRGRSCTVKDIADLIFEDKVIAVFNGLAEAGPRALGNRSILFNPWNKNGKDRVNEVKKREWYRPFAASVLEEDAANIFNMLDQKNNPYMTISFDINDNFIGMFPSIEHVDKTCRIQTVDRSIHHMYNLLSEIRNRKGYGIILNTSFNLAGEPLVESFEDAIKTMKRSSIDAVWFPETSRIIFKDDIE
jgi:carbamoyltransferase